MSIDTQDSDLGLAEIDAVQPPDEVWNSAVAVAVDPATPAPEDDLVPDPDSLVTDAGGADDTADDIDLSEFDDGTGADSVGDGTIDVQATDLPADETVPTTDTALTTYDEDTFGTDNLHHDAGADDLEIGSFDSGADAGL